MTKTPKSVSMHYHKEPTSGDWLHPRTHQVLPLDDSMSYTSLTAACVEVFVFSLDLFAPALFESFEFSFRGNIFSAPWNKTLCVQSHSDFGQFLALEHCRKLWLPLRQAKQSFCSATFFARWVALFFWKRNNSTTRDYPYTKRTAET